MFEDSRTAVGNGSDTCGDEVVGFADIRGRHQCGWSV